MKALTVIGCLVMFLSGVAAALANVAIGNAAIAALAGFGAGIWFVLILWVSVS